MIVHNNVFTSVSSRQGHSGSNFDSYVSLRKMMLQVIWVSQTAMEQVHGKSYTTKLWRISLLITWTWLELRISNHNEWKSMKPVKIMKIYVTFYVKSWKFAIKEVKKRTECNFLCLYILWILFCNFGGWGASGTSGSVFFRFLLNHTDFT